MYIYIYIYISLYVCLYLFVYLFVYYTYVYNTCVVSVDAHMHTNKCIHVHVYTVSEGDMAPFGKFKAQHLAGQVQLERRLDPDGGAVPPGQEGGMIFHQRYTCDAGHHPS